MGDDTTTTENPTLERDDFMTRVESVLDPAYRLATVILLDYTAAEDVVHGATLRAWSRYRAIHGEVTSFRTWFLEIVAERSRRRAWWRRVALRGGDVGRVGGPRDIVGDLQPAWRVALFCRVSLGLPDDEVARILGTSPIRVRSRVFRARERVTAELNRREEDET
jgi:DNA-directed RNA polymerase specialized sigma24 family protein